MKERYVCVARGNKNALKKGTWRVGKISRTVNLNKTPQAGTLRILAVRICR
jgi:hypothetical protein